MNSPRVVGDAIDERLPAPRQRILALLFRIVLLRVASHFIVARGGWTPSMATHAAARIRR